jgi:radical SAM superfamily enzyme YgiQ (UPF0313 family)
VADVVVAVIMDFPALLKTVEALAAFRKKYPKARVVCFGPYAELNAGTLGGKYGCEVIRGPDESQAVQHVLGGLPLGLVSGGKLVPDRSDFPPLTAYPRTLVPDGLGKNPDDPAGMVEKVVGNLELSRGCIHRCLYCSVAALSDGAQAMNDERAVLADLDGLVRQGAQHVAVIDADAFSFPTPVIGLIRKMHAAHPRLTFEAVTRVDHVIKIRHHLPELRACGLVRLTSSLEAPSDKVLQAVNKGFAADRIEPAVRLCRDNRIQMKPTFIPWNPWSTLEEIFGLRQFLKDVGLEASTDPSQLCTRLLLYKGSPLLRTASVQALRLTEKEFHYDWAHPDPAVDRFFDFLIAAAGPGGRCCIRC